MIITVVFLALAGCEVGEQWVHVNESRAAISHGAKDRGHDCVGFLTKAGDLVCTATLVGRRTVLTAAHCFADSRARLFHSGSSVYSLKWVILHPDYQPRTSTSAIQNDLALARLEGQPVASPCPVSPKPPQSGLAVTLVGFGNTEFTRDDATINGEKRKATNTIADVFPTEFRVNGSGQVFEGSTCPGDSGGPTFAMMDGHELQIGVHSVGFLDCGSHQADVTEMRVDAALEWMLRHTNRDLLVGEVEQDLDMEPKNAGGCSLGVSSTTASSVLVLIALAFGVLILRRLSRAG